jgi:hypothetical protein
VPISALVLLTNLTISRVKVAGYGYAPEVGPAGTLIFGAMQLLIGINFSRLLVARHRSETVEKKRRYLWIAVAELLPLLGAALDGFTCRPWRLDEPGFCRLRPGHSPVRMFACVWPAR